MAYIDVEWEDEWAMMDEGPSWMGLVGQGIFLLPVLASAWAFGGVSEPVVSLLAPFVAIALAVVWIWQRHTGRLSGLEAAIGWLVFGGVLLGLFQQCPVSPEVLGWFSPMGAALQWREPGDELRWAAVSAYPAGTAHDTALLCLYLGAYFVGIAAGRGGRRTWLWVFTIIGIHGAALAFFGIAQQLTWNNLLYWRIALSEGGHAFASFVNRNNAAGYLNLTLAAAMGWIGLLLAESRRRIGGRWWLPGQPRPFHAPTTAWHVRLTEIMMNGIARIDTPTLIAFVAATCMAAGVLASLSRAGAVAMFLAMATLGVSLWTARRAYVAVGTLGALAGAAFLLAAWADLAPAVRDRLASVLDEQTLMAEARFRHWKQTLSAVPDFWKTGSGLGTYRYVYRLYQRNGDEPWFYHAENHYLETLVETGFMGAGLLLAAIAVYWVRVIGLLRAPRVELLPAALVGWFLGVSQLSHAAFDFGWYIPSNGLLAAYLVGMVMGWRSPTADGLRGVTTTKKQPLGGPTRVAARGRWGSGLATLLSTCLPWLCLTAVLGAGYRLARDGRISWWLAQTVMDTAPVTVAGTTELNEVTVRIPFAVRPSRRPLTQIELERAISALADLAAQEPHDARIQLRLGRLYVDLFRLREFYRRQAVFPRESPAASWKSSSLTEIQDQLARRPNAQQPITHHPEIVQLLGQANDHLRRACALLPLEPTAFLWRAEVAALLQQPQVVSHALAHVAQVAPWDARVPYLAGVVALRAGQANVAIQQWHRSLSVAPTMVKEITELLTNYFANQPESVSRTVPDIPECLIAVLQHLADQLPTARQMLLARLHRLLEGGDGTSAKWAILRGDTAVLESQWATAYQYYLQALTQSPHNIECRHKLVQVCLRLGRVEDAYEHALVCQAAEPTSRVYHDLVMHIRSLRPRPRSSDIPAPVATPPNADKPDD